jgi:hypothetical protein
MQRESVRAVVSSAHAVVGRQHVVSALADRIPWIVGAAAAGALSRPFSWPLHDAPPSRAVVRALVLAASATLIIVGGLILVAWRRRPSPLFAARRLDGALGQRETIASAFAFESANAIDEMKQVAIARASNIVRGVDVARVLRIERTWHTRRNGLCAGALLVALACGAIDRSVVTRMVNPPTARESSAASALARAAQAAAKEAEDPKEQALVDAAKRAAAAADRGDRTRALEALDDARRASRALDARERARARALRTVQKEASSGASGSASEALAQLRDEIGKAAEAKAAAERLDKTEAAMREAAREGGSPSLSKESAALGEAKAAMARGDKEAAAHAVERAREALAGLESKKDSGAMREVASSAAELDKSMRGGGGREGKEPGEKGIAEGSGRPSKDEPSDPGTSRGPGKGDRTPGTEGRRIDTKGDLQARADPKNGERVVSAIEGMGRGDPERAFKEVFPSYDTVVEDGLREDAVPAGRRDAVRRYFSSIRPDRTAP